MRGERRSIAIAQTCAVPGDVSANIARHLRLIRTVCDEGAQLVLFPELSLTGYELGRASDLAFSTEDPRLDPLRQFSTRSSATLVVGAPVRIEARLHIGAFIITADGASRIYTKGRLGAFSPAAGRDGVVPPPEAHFFQPGEGSSLVEWCGMRAAVAICAEVGDPEHPRNAARRGASLYLASMFIIPSEYTRECDRLQSHARDYGMVVAMSNHGRSSGGLAAAGGSALWSETGELVARLPSSGSAVLIATKGDDWRSRVLFDR